MQSAYERACVWLVFPLPRAYMNARGEYFLVFGAACFYLMAALDYVNRKRQRAIYYVVQIAVIALSCISHIAIAGHPIRWSLPRISCVLCWFLSGLFVLLLLYSLVFELNFKKTYARIHDSRRLIATGTYAMTRHPGVLWYALFLVSLFFATGSKYMFYAVFLWSGSNVVYACIQDRFVFPIIFGDAYPEYQKTTPLLIPTSRSLQTCLKTLRGVKSES
jgi:protein-S-isoprenylcysteine O-methyltransferase Ste14